jgi:hypothetical protein
MQTDPIQEWQHLTEHYREMSDEELYELADDIGNLTETAQQVLRSEMQSRGLANPDAAKAVSPLNMPAPAMSRIEPEPGPDHPAITFGFLGRMPQLVSHAPGGDAGDGGPHDYTWKTALCDCDTNEQAQELSAVLQRAGLDSWIQQSIEFGRPYARVLVAADQLDAARAIAANPIPQEIVDESTEVAEFVEPNCPKCGSDDVVLEGVDPANAWRCEQCSAQWSESTQNEDGS